MKILCKLTALIVSLILFSSVYATARLPGGSSGNIGSRPFTANADGSEITVTNPDGTTWKFEWVMLFGYCKSTSHSKDAYICLIPDGTDDKDKTNDSVTFWYYPPNPEIGPPQQGSSFGTAKVKYK